MAFISKQDFTTHIFEEAIAKISRGDDAKLDEAISTGMSKAKRCLTRYDIAAIFATEGEAKAPYAELITYIKDIAKWHFIGVANVQVDYDVAKQRYDSAVKELEKLGTGPAVPDWPLLEPAPVSNLRYGSKPKIKW